MLSSTGQTFGLVGGSRCTIVPDWGYSSCDQLLEQMPPLGPTMWGGLEYYTAPVLMTDPGPPVQYREYLVRMFSLASPQTINLASNGAYQPGPLKPCPPGPSFTLARGDYCDLLVWEDLSITTDHPLQVYQYARSQTEIPPLTPVIPTDPFEMLVVPVNHFVCHHRFFSFPGFGYQNKVTVVVPILAVGTTLLDNVPIPAPLYHVLPGGTHAWALLDVTAGEHTVDGRVLGAPVPVAVYVHGHKDTSSYGYPAGYGFD